MNREQRRRLRGQAGCERLPSSALGSLTAGEGVGLAERVLAGQAGLDDLLVLSLPERVTLIRVLVRIWGFRHRAATKGLREAEALVKEHARLVGFAAGKLALAVAVQEAWDREAGLAANGEVRHFDKSG